LRPGIGSRVMDDDLRPASRLDIASVAALLSEPARVSIVSALMDGQARPATELARIAGVSPSTGSEHLALLTRGGLLRVDQHGRHRYHRLANDAGPLGVGLTKGLLEVGWVRRKPSTRALRVTVEGARAFRDSFGLSVEAR